MEAILYVEDEAFVREVVREILGTAGYRVFAAGTAAEAGRIYEEHATEIDLLLTDVILPGEKGCNLAARLLRMNASLKVLLVTGYGDQLVKREEMGEECLAKPFTSEGLLERVRRLLDQREFLPEREVRVRQTCGGV